MAVAVVPASLFGEGIVIRWMAKTLGLLFVGCRCWTDVRLIGDPPVGGDSPLCGCQADRSGADQGVELVLDPVLDPGPFGGVVGLGPQVGLRAGRTTELQGDEVVFFVVTSGPPLRNR